MTKSLNSKDHGVPQNRERVFIIGHLRGRSGREVFPVEGTDGENRAAINQIGRSNVTQRENPSAYRTYDTDGVSPTLTNMAGGGREPHIGVPVRRYGKANV
ncbi:MAG: DNA cytosine methyltransferase [Anaerotignum sp.]|nr:DNA cytosine methyltransferase [Anaerotignum sp.]